VIAKVHARAVQAVLQRVDRDTEPLGGFGRAQLLDVAQQHHLAMERNEIAKGSGVIDPVQQLNAPRTRTSQPSTVPSWVTSFPVAFDSPMEAPRLVVLCWAAANHE